MFPRRVVVGCMTAMASIGALYAVYGASVAGFQARFDVNEATAGVALTLQSAGAIAGVLIAPLVAHRFSDRTALGSAMAMVLLGASGIALASSWQVTISAAIVAGLGMGGCDLLISQLLILGTGAHGPALVNLAHGFFGIGTVLAAAAVAAVGTDNYRLAFVLIAVAATPGLLTVRGMGQRPAAALTTQEYPRARGKRRHRTGMWVMAGFILLYITHFGVQTGFGTWAPTLLEDLGNSASHAVLLTSGFWLAMVAGRFGAAAVAHRVPVQVLVTASCALMTAAAVVATIDSVAVPALLAAGFFIGPIFPNGLTWLALCGHGDGNRFAYVMAASMLGMALPPWLVGVAIEHEGPTVMPVVVAAIAATALAASLTLSALTSRNREKSRA
jgi:fucose permease